MQYHGEFGALAASDVVPGSVRFGSSHRRQSLPLQLRNGQNEPSSDGTGEEVFLLREGDLQQSNIMEQPLGSEAVIDFDRAKVLRGIELTLGPAPATTSGDDTSQTQTRSAVRVNILVGESVVCARNVLLRLEPNFATAHALYCG